MPYNPPWWGWPVVVVGVVLVVGGLFTLPLALLGLLATGMGDYSDDQPRSLSGV